MLLRNSSPSTSVDEIKGISIIVDSREQAPLWRAPQQKLNVGDYTTTKLLRTFAIERKSPGDLYQTITRGHVRFRKEILRAEEAGIKLVVYTECSKAEFVSKSFLGGSRLEYPSSGLERIVDTISYKYDIEFVWCRNREDLKVQVEKRLRNEEWKLMKSKRLKARSNRSRMT